jgi:hypothetical protein
VLSELALYEDDWPLLREIGDEIRQLPHEAVSLRIRRWRDAMFLLCRHLDGFALDPQSLINTLTIEHVPQYESGDIGDLEMTVLLTILRGQNFNEAARAAYSRYIASIRRSSAPLSAALRHASAGLAGIAPTVSLVTERE